MCALPVRRMSSVDPDQRVISELTCINASYYCNTVEAPLTVERFYTGLWEIKHPYLSFICDWSKPSSPIRLFGTLGMYFLR